MTADSDTPTAPYDFASIEKKWQAFWKQNATFKTPNPGDAGFDPSKPKFYVLDMFPYPSGAGLHVGHPIGYCATDIYARYKRMRGFNVLHPMGYDAFGLPAEQYAIETGVHPVVTTKANIDNMRRQLKMFGFSYDWDREFATCEPEFYKHTQWIFIQLFNSWFDPVADAARPVDELISRLKDGDLAVDGALDVTRHTSSHAVRQWDTLGEDEQNTVLDRQRLAYIDEVMVNWCPALGTVLANEEVTNEGRSDRGNHLVYRRPLRQWMLRITKYAQRLLNDVDKLDWPEAIKAMQRNWIGRSTGAEVDFPIVSAGDADVVVSDMDVWRRERTNGFPARPRESVIRVYTTRPDTLHGATYMVLAPEHPLVESITTKQHRDAVTAYVASARHRSDLDRTTDTKTKTGVFTGGFALNPVNGRHIPVWVADYVLMGYGTGAIMAVPGGDERDFEFAKVFDLDIVAVVQPTLEWARNVARLPKGSLAELRAAATKQLAESVERWKAEECDTRNEAIRFASEHLAADGPDAGLTPDAIQHLYVATPRVFEAPFSGEGVGVHSPASDSAESDDVCVLNGLPTADAKQTIIRWLEKRGLGRGAVNYKIRDWVFSRQKYWGEPFPVLHGEDGRTIALDEFDLPLTLPEMTDFKPEAVEDDAETLPRPPLAREEDWMTVERDGIRYTRDANTMPQWAGSCWYYLRFVSPKLGDRFCDAEAERYWMPVDLYVGGAEHAVLHLLYARFWHKVLFDLGEVSTAEPFGELVNQGMVQAVAYRDRAGRILNDQHVEPVGGGKFATRDGGEPVHQITAKMSKSLKNTVSPDEIISEFGADAFRLYEMYMGPIEASKPWNTRDVPGLSKLLHRIWRLVVDESSGDLSAALVNEPGSVDVNRALHKAIQRITDDVEQFKFNTAIAQLFEFVNFLTPQQVRPRHAIETFVRMLAPFAPHIAEELWQRLGHEGSIASESWPAFDAALARDDEVEIAVQVMGKVRSRITVPADADDQVLQDVALSDEKIARAIAGKTVRKVIVVKGRLVNIVAT